MLQRVQSIYLFSLFILYLVLLLVPWNNFISGGGFYSTYSYGIKPGMTAGAKDLIPLAINYGVISLLALLTVLLYKNRILQMWLVRISIFLAVASIVMLIFLILHLKKNYPDARFSYSIVTVFPIISIVLYYLALRHIKKDQSVIDSLNRIR